MRPSIQWWSLLLCARSSPLRSLALDLCTSWMWRNAFLHSTLSETVYLLTPFFDTCQGKWFLWREGGRFGRNQKMHSVGIGRWSPFDGPGEYCAKMLIYPFWCSADGKLPMKSRKEKRIQTIRESWWLLKVLKCHFYPSTILNNKGKLHALLTYLYH